MTDQPLACDFVRVHTDVPAGMAAARQAVRAGRQPSLGERPLRAAVRARLRAERSARRAPVREVRA